MRKILFRSSAVACVALLALWGVLAAAEHTEHAKASPEALKRTRKTVRMLDDVYKSAIVLITEKYVNTKDDFPAGSAAVEWFKHISEKGWHDIRLIDATGEPTVASNVAKDDFEREGIKSLKAGKDYVEMIESRDGKIYLRAMTPVPVVLKKCIMCHPHYANVKAGQPIGALTYTLTIE